MSARMNKPMTLAAQRREAVERAFPGVICKRVAFECAYRPAGDDSFRDWAGGKRYSLNLTVEASAETLVSHGLVEQEEIDSLPPSGRRYDLEKTNRGTYQASVHYFEHFDTPTVAREMAAKIGISDPRHKVYSSSGWRSTEVEPREVETKSNVIQFPNKPLAIQRQDWISRFYAAIPRDERGSFHRMAEMWLRGVCIQKGLPCPDLGPLPDCEGDKAS